MVADAVRAVVGEGCDVEARAVVCLEEVEVTIVVETLPGDEIVVIATSPLV